MPLFDMSHDDDSRFGGYPSWIHGPFLTVRDLQLCGIRQGVYRRSNKVDGDCPSYSIVSAFFNAVVDGLKDMKGKVRWEIIDGGIFVELVKMKCGKDILRPEGKYMRIWQSNVPDYPSNSAIYAAPLFEIDIHASVSANCMLNSISWRSGEQFCHNFSLLMPSEFHRYLGYKVKDMKPMFGLITLTPPPKGFPLALSQLATREEMYSWLSKVLFHIIAQGQPRQEPARPRMPNNRPTQYYPSSAHRRFSRALVVTVPNRYHCGQLENYSTSLHRRPSH
ncbi:hypothetical protein VKT23_011810 [Stygiomarasmius scandens]|uniref:Uncharacterized protein n=1 Tax=Marasmiellus scandens TaxID=2682957 RepID=A0ABR1JAR1_9AGAR